MAEGAERQILKFIVPRSPEMSFSTVADKGHSRTKSEITPQ